MTDEALTAKRMADALRRAGNKLAKTEDDTFSFAADKRRIADARLADLACLVADELDPPAPEPKFKPGELVEAPQGGIRVMTLHGLVGLGGTSTVWTPRECHHVDDHKLLQVTAAEIRHMANLAYGEPK